MAPGTLEEHEVSRDWFWQRVSLNRMGAEGGPNWHTKRQAKELGCYILERYTVAGKGGWTPKVFHWESDIWSTEFREGLFVFSPTKEQVSRQAT